jgi:uncharacterized protein (UPF0216 family)
MTGWRKRQVVELAREAGAVFPADGSYHKFERHEDLEAFAALVREGEREKWMERTAILIRGEREACAKVCEDSNTWDLHDPNGFAANLIRARTDHDQSKENT